MRRTRVSPRTEEIFTGRSQKEAAKRPSPLRAARRRIPRTPPTGSTGTMFSPASNASSTPEYLVPGNYPSSGSSIPTNSSRIFAPRSSSRGSSIRSAARSSPLSPVPFNLSPGPTPTYSNASDSPGPAVMSPMMTPGKVLEGEAQEEGLTVKEVRGIISKMKKAVRGPAYSRRLKAANKYQILREQFNAVKQGCARVEPMDDVYTMMKTPDRARRYGGIDPYRREVRAAQELEELRQLEEEPRQDDEFQLSPEEEQQFIEELIRRQQIQGRIFHALREAQLPTLFDTIMTGIEHVMNGMTVEDFVDRVRRQQTGGRIPATNPPAAALDSNDSMMKTPDRVRRYGGVRVPEVTPHINPPVLKMDEEVNKLLFKYLQYDVARDLFQKFMENPEGPYTPKFLMLEKFLEPHRRQESIRILLTKLVNLFNNSTGSMYLPIRQEQDREPDPHPTDHVVPGEDIDPHPTDHVVPGGSRVARDSLTEEENEILDTALRNEVTAALINEGLPATVQVVNKVLDYMNEGLSQPDAIDMIKQIVEYVRDSLYARGVEPTHENVSREMTQNIG